MGEPVSITEPHKESIEARIDVDFSMKMYRKCLDRGGFIPSQDTLWPVDVKDDVIRGLIDENKDALDRHHLDEEVIKAIDLPVGMDMEKEARVGIQKVISIISKSGLVDLTAVRGASRYIGPANTVYKPGRWDHNFLPTSQYHEFLRARYPERTVGQPLPPPEGQRGKFFELWVGEYGVKAKTREFEERAEDIGLVIKRNQAVRIALVRGTAHEYGHSIKRALDFQGIKTQDRAIKEGYIKDIELLDPIIDVIHDEHFARAIELAVTRKNIVDELQISNETVDNYMQALTRVVFQHAEAAYAYMEYAKQKGYTPYDIRAMDVALPLAFDRLYEKDFVLWSIQMLVSYGANPYSQEQLRNLVTR